MLYKCRDPSTHQQRVLFSKCRLNMQATLDCLPSYTIVRMQSGETPQLGKQRKKPRLGAKQLNNSSVLVSCASHDSRTFFQWFWPQFGGNSGPRSSYDYGSFLVFSEPQRQNISDPCSGKFRLLYIYACLYEHTVKKLKP